MIDIDRILDELGVRAQLKPAKQIPPTDWPDGPPNTWRGIWYADGNIPH